MSGAPKTVTHISKDTSQSILEKLKALDAQRAELLDGAKREALDKANEAVSVLNSLGFDYRLVEKGLYQRESQQESRAKPEARIIRLSDKSATRLVLSVTSKPLRRMTGVHIEGRRKSAHSLSRN